MSKRATELRKLFFDDVRDIPDLTWTVSRDVPAAIRLMEQQKFDVISLDHDIGFQMLCDRCYEEIDAKYEMNVDRMRATLEYLGKGCQHTQTGTHLAEWMAANTDKWVVEPQLVVLHSGSEPARKRMMSILKDLTKVIDMPYNPSALRSIRWED